MSFSSFLLVSLRRLSSFLSPWKGEGDKSRDRGRSTRTLFLLSQGFRQPQLFSVDLDPLFSQQQQEKLKTPKNSITVAGKPVAVVSDPALLLEASSLPKPATQHSGTSAALSGPQALESVPDVSSSAAPATAAAARAAFDSACSKKASAGSGGYLEALANAGDALTAALIGAGPDETVDMGDLLERAAIDAALSGVVGIPAKEDSAAALDSGAFKAKRSQPKHELLGAIRAARAATPATALLHSPRPAAPAVADLKAKVAGLATELESRGAPAAADASAGAALVRSGLSGPELAANLTTAVLHGMRVWFLTFFLQKVSAREEKPFSFFSNSHNLSSTLISNHLKIQTTGASPVAVAAAWVLAHMASEPTAADKVTREMLEAGLLCHGDDRAPKRVSPADLERLPFLMACVKETMRLHPTGMPAAGMLRQASGHASSVGGVALPAGALVVLAAPVASMASASFPQPSRFWPEGRWLESAVPRGHVYKSIDEKLLPVQAFSLRESAGPAGAFAPAGFAASSSSSRACPASAIAADAVAILAGAVLANFRHRLADDVGGMKGALAQRASAGEAGGADAGHCGGGWKVKTGLRMVCVPRSATGFSRNV